MAIELDTAHRYQVLLDGSPTTRPPAAFVGSNGLLFLTDAADGTVWATPQAPGDVTLSVTVGPRTGSVDVHVTAPEAPEPIVITFGAGVSL